MHLGRNFILTVALLAAIPALAVDLDVAAAEARYLAQKSISDSAKSRLDAEESFLSAAQSRLEDAQRSESSARAQLRQDQAELNGIDQSISSNEQAVTNLDAQIRSDERRASDLDDQIGQKQRERGAIAEREREANREIRMLERRIVELESKPQTGPWTCVYVDHGTEEHSGGHRATNNDRSAAEEEAKKACLAVHGRCDLAGCSQPQGHEIEQLRRRLEEAERQQRDLQSKLSQIDRDIQSLQRDVRSLEDDMNNCRNQQNVKLNEIARLNRERDSVRIQISNDSSEVTRCANITASALQDVNRQMGPYNLALSNYQTEKLRTDGLYGYWQQVVANYNAALKDVLSRSDAKARRDADAEAQGRAAGPGDQAGLATGNQQGTDKGLGDVRDRDRASGYIQGRTTASTEAQLANSYAAGTASGDSMAVEKARLENFPVGYNQVLAGLFNAPPTLNQTVDISDSLSSEPGGNGVLLQLKNKAIGHGVAPSVIAPKTPVLNPPSYQAPSVNIPAALKTNYAPQCNDVVLPEFKPRCLDQYESSYGSGFDASYQSVYSSHYKDKFVEASQTAYSAVVAQTNAEAFEAGRQSGAQDQGLLDGFSNNLAKRMDEQKALGQTQVATDLEGGGLVVVRGASLADSNGDGLLTTGERVRLRLVIDNYGKQATALEAIQFHLAGTKGVGEASVTLRTLPALVAETRTTLEGVLTAPITSEMVGGELGLSGAVEVSATPKIVLGSASGAGAVHFPIEVTDIKLAKDPAVNEVVDAVVKFSNLTAVKSLEQKLALKTSPVFATVEGTVPALAPIEAEATGEVKVRLKPGPWVGENTFTRFKADLTNGSDTLSQAFPKYIHINRSASLLLLDRAQKAIPDSTIDVQAGGWAIFNAQMVYQEKVYQRGPMVMSFSKASDPGIQLAAGGTTSVNYGYLSPGAKQTPVGFTFFVPQSLKGKTAWVMMLATENGALLHSMMVYLNVK
ncbi:MAG: hypothetical protein HYZ71_15740 [Deltaproteobacteria bacterium]|nr:hypothetical protein [Deltaproteobacteria bacterium]